MNENKRTNIKTHLEFLGYSVEASTGEKGDEFLIAKSSSKPNLIVWFGKPEDNKQYVIFNSNWNGVKKVEHFEQLKYINKINDALVVTKATVDFSDDTMTFRSTYIGDYDKKVFGDFLDLMLDGIKQAMAGEEFKTLFLEKK